MSYNSIIKVRTANAGREVLMKSFLSKAVFILGCVALIVTGVMILFHLVNEAWAGFAAILILGLFCFIMGLIGMVKNRKHA